MFTASSRASGGGGERSERLKNLISGRNVPGTKGLCARNPSRGVSGGVLCAQSRLVDLDCARFLRYMAVFASNPLGWGEGSEFQGQSHTVLCDGQFGFDTHVFYLVMSCIP